MWQSETPIPDSASKAVKVYVNHGRNQCVKENIYLVIRNNDYSKTHCYLPEGKEGKEKIMEFKNDHQSAY